MYKQFNVFILTICSALCFMTSATQAQLLEKSTSAKDVSFLFHKMAGIPIDYRQWAAQTQEYATAVEQRKESVLNEQILKLQMEHAGLDQDKSDIIIRTQITTKVDDTPEIGLHLDFSADGPLFFPYNYLEENYAVIAQNIDLLKFIPLGKLESAYIKNKISMHGKTYMVLKVRPHRVDATEKTEIYKKKYWLMLGRIASMHLYNTELETLWSWTSDWYIKEQEDTEVDALTQ